jgi:short-subunit dehydrogenase
MAVIEIIILYIKLFYVLFKHWFRDLFQSFTSGPSLKDLSSETILITGAASGLGKGIAQRLAALGSTLVLWDVDEENNARVAQELNNATKSRRIHAMKCDLTDRENIYECARKVNRRCVKEI